jgi:hypothetical protein
MCSTASGDFDVIEITALAGAADACGCGVLVEQAETASTTIKIARGLMDPPCRIVGVRIRTQLSCRKDPPILGPNSRSAGAEARSLATILTELSDKTRHGRLSHATASRV